MNDTTPDLAGKAWALRLGAALVAAFVLILVQTFIDRAGRQQLEVATDRGPVAKQR